MLVELKNGETLNGHLVNCDTWMNLTLKEVVQTSPEGDRFYRLAEVYVRGNNVGGGHSCFETFPFWSLLNLLGRLNIFEFQKRSWIWQRNNSNKTSKTIREGEVDPDIAVMPAVEGIEGVGKVEVEGDVEEVEVEVEFESTRSITLIIQH